MTLSSVINALFRSRPLRPSARSVLLDLPPPTIDVLPTLDIPESLHPRLGDIFKCPAPDHPRLHIDPFFAPLLHPATADILLDREHEIDVALAHKRHAGALTARARRPAHAMDIVGRVPRHVVVDDEAHVGDVEASRRDVRGDQDAGFLRSEVGEVARPLRLRQCRVQ